jgi:hypothetical protein
MRHPLIRTRARKTLALPRVQRTRPVTTKELFEFSEVATQAQLLRSAQFLHRELPIRIAQRLTDYHRLPFIIACNPYLREVYELYVAVPNHICDARVAVVGELLAAAAAVVVAAAAAAVVVVVVAGGGGGGWWWWWWLVVVVVAVDVLVVMMAMKCLRLGQLNLNERSLYLCPPHEDDVMPFVDKQPQRCHLLAYPCSTFTLALFHTVPIRVQVL